MPAGRPLTGCSPMGRTTAPRQDPTVAQCTNVPMHTVHQTQVGAHHSGALWYHLGARDPTAGSGWWQPLNPTCPTDDGEPTHPAQHKNRFKLS